MGDEKGVKTMKMKTEKGWSAVDGYGRRVGQVGEHAGQKQLCDVENRYRKGRKRIRVAHVEVREIE